MRPDGCPGWERCGEPAGLGVPRVGSEGSVLRHCVRCSQSGGTPRSPSVRRHEYDHAMTENLRVERGWIVINASRQDDGAIRLGTGGEMRFSPFEAVSERQDASITWGHILKASVQRLAFWHR